MLPYSKSLISCVTACREWFDRAKNGRKRRMKEESTECRRCINWRQRMRARTHRLTTHQFLLELFRNIHEDSSVLQLKFKERSCCYIDHFRQLWTWRKSKLWSNEWWARGKSNIHTDFSRSPTVFVPTKRAKVKVNPKLKREKTGTSLIGKTSTVIGAKWKGELSQMSRVENWSNHSSTSRPWLNFWSKKCLWNDKKPLTRRRKHAQIWT